MSAAGEAKARRVRRRAIDPADKPDDRSHTEPRRLEHPVTLGKRHWITARAGMTDLGMPASSIVVMLSDHVKTPRMTASDREPSSAALEQASPRYFFSGSSFFLSLPSMYWLHGCARTGPGVFQTTLNCPLACTSPMNTGFHR